MSIDLEKLSTNTTAAYTRWFILRRKLDRCQDLFERANLQAEVENAENEYWQLSNKLQPLQTKYFLNLQESFFARARAAGYTVIHKDEYITEFIPPNSVGGQSNE